MMKHILITLLCVFIFSCKSNIVGQNKLSGTYYKKGVDFEYTLILKDNKTFILKKVFFSHGQSSCEGNWHYNKTNDEMLVLKCFEIKNPTETLSSLYMPKRDYEIMIIGKDSLKLDKIILKKVHR